MPLTPLFRSPLFGLTHDPHFNPRAARIEITYAGRGEYAAFVPDDEGGEINRMQAQRPDLLSWISKAHPGLPGAIRSGAESSTALTLLVKMFSSSCQLLKVIVNLRHH